MSTLTNVRCSPARVLFDGQSLNQLPTPNTYPRQLMTALYKGHNWANAAVGATSWTVLGPSERDRLAYLASISRFTIWIGCGGTSDLIPPESNDGPTLAADMAAYADVARTLGCDYLIQTTVTQSTAMSGGQNTNRIAGNALVLADGGAHYDAVCDFAGNPDLDDPADTTWYSDGLHWTDAGALSAANQMLPYLRTAIGKAWAFA